MKKPMLGVIADDYTGATDIASMLVRGGMDTVQTIGTPSHSLGEALKADAVVIALKSRSLAASEAVAQSLEALERLQALGVEQIYFKYCSTFDSTPEGNIGPVSDALCAALGVKTIAHIPALPINGRSVYQGHLFVGTQLLHQSGMEHHPLNPMTDANLVRWLGQQTPHEVHLVGNDLLQLGAGAITKEIDRIDAGGGGHIIGDTVRDSDLPVWASVLQNSPLVAGGSGLAAPLARLHMANTTGTKATPRQATAQTPPQPTELAPPALDSHAETGHALILSGSCSKATLAQIEAFKARGGHCLHLDPLTLSKDPSHLTTVLAAAVDALKTAPVLIYASGTPQQVQATQASLGVEAAGALVEAAFATLAKGAAAQPQTRQLIVAGGETSGAVVSALGVAALQIGPEIAPGVPWTGALGADGERLLPLALKSGNFGGPDFFNAALQMETQI
jgi:uncharacterized protein YgbK (DUF1537 family)